MTPAAVIATELSLPLVQFNSKMMQEFATGQRMGQWSPVTNVLLVDDSIYAGTAMTSAAMEIEHAWPDFKTCAIYVDPRRAHLADIHGPEIGPPRCFEWNLWNSWVTKKGVFDMDGVICHDPTAFDDDGVAYINDLSNAVLKHRPIKPRMILTHRLERHRHITESWLHRHGIFPEALVMAPHDTASDRRADPDILSGAWKARHYWDSGANVMIESHDKWASRIRDQLRTKPVISLESNRVFR
jgi:hypothetical protein